jgi:quinol monooxygenase YgiN
MELFIFARFHAREGDEAVVAAALRDVVVPTRPEPGCLAINAFRSIRDSRQRGSQPPPHAAPHRQHTVK